MRLGLGYNVITSIEVYVYITLSGLGLWLGGLGLGRNVFLLSHVEYKLVAHRLCHVVDDLMDLCYCFHDVPFLISNIHYMM